MRDSGWGWEKEAKVQAQGHTPFLGFKGGGCTWGRWILPHVGLGNRAALGAQRTGGGFSGRAMTGRRTPDPCGGGGRTTPGPKTPSACGRERTQRLWERMARDTCGRWSRDFSAGEGGPTPAQAYGARGSRESKCAGHLEARWMRARIFVFTQVSSPGKLHHLTPYKRGRCGGKASDAAHPLGPVRACGVGYHCHEPRGGVVLGSLRTGVRGAQAMRPVVLPLVRRPGLGFGIKFFR